MTNSHCRSFSKHNLTVTCTIKCLFLMFVLTQSKLLLERTTIETQLWLTMSTLSVLACSNTLVCSTCFFSSSANMLCECVCVGRCEGCVGWGCVEWRGCVCVGGGRCEGWCGVRVWEVCCVGGGGGGCVGWGGGCKSVWGVCRVRMWEVCGGGECVWMWGEENVCVGWGRCV